MPLDVGVTVLVCLSSLLPSRCSYCCCYITVIVVVVPVPVPAVVVVVVVVVVVIAIAVPLLLLLLLSLSVLLVSFSFWPAPQSIYVTVVKRCRLSDQIIEFTIK